VSDWRTDARGHLLDAGTWTPDFARAAAAAEDIELGAGHWAVIEWLRAQYAGTSTVPTMRALVRATGPLLGSAESGTRLLYRLFPVAPLRQACRIAGLPKPASCI
jgi:tRNA 2-thiouridine synthesizing protein E